MKCDEERPDCRRCRRLRLKCAWAEQLMHSVAQQAGLLSGQGDHTDPMTAMQLARPAPQTFVVEFPNASRSTMPYIKHFVTFCSRFIAYPNDAEGNPFQEELVPLATSSPALLHSMVALAAGHMARSEPSHSLPAVKHYSTALRELQAALSDPSRAASNSTLGACLLLCVYEASHTDRSYWLKHLQGAKELLMYRGGPKTSDFLSRFFSLLDISGSLLTGQGPLIEGNYWLEDSDSQRQNSSSTEKKPQWPYYDEGAVMVDNYHMLMVYMAKLSKLSAESMTDNGKREPQIIREKAMSIRQELYDWWQRCPPALRDQSNDWRRIPRARKLTMAEMFEEESFSSTRSCLYGCIIYLHHIIDPTGKEPQAPEVAGAIEGILDIARETPEGFGLEMGLLFGLFMAGIAISDNDDAETLIRRKLKSNVTISIYHADRGLELLEVLWSKQRRFHRKFDWRGVQNEMGVQVFIMV